MYIGVQAVQEMLEFLRQRCFESQPLTASRVRELNGGSVKEIARQAEHGRS